MTRKCHNSGTYQLLAVGQLPQPSWRRQYSDHYWPDSSNCLHLTHSPSQSPACKNNTVFTRREAREERGVAYLLDVWLGKGSLFLNQRYLGHGVPEALQDKTNRWPATAGLASGCCVNRTSSEQRETLHPSYNTWASVIFYPCIRDLSNPHRTSYSSDTLQVDHT